jgi:hypothetical protein
MEYSRLIKSDYSVAAAFADAKNQPQIVVAIRAAEIGNSTNQSFCPRPPP